jgi:NAD(P)-dependent dehydrogenase (short-subunit alcohol dehydrogenase family)
MRLADKVAIITGAASGIGRGIALMFAREGARVAVADVNDAGGAETVQQVESLGGSALFVHCDVSVAAEVNALVQATVARFGRLDILVNNAVYDRGDAAVADLDEAVWDRTLAVTLRGPFLCSKYALPEMIKGGGGVILHISSGCGIVGCGNSAAYSAAKGGLELLSRSLAIDYGQYNIRVNTIAPGGTRTPRAAGLERPEVRARAAREHLIQRTGEPEDTAYAAVYLASDEASWVTAVSLPVDGGWVARPGGMQRRE